MGFNEVQHPVQSNFLLTRHGLATWDRNLDRSHSNQNKAHRDNKKFLFFLLTRKSLVNPLLIPLFPPVTMFTRPAPPSWPGNPARKPSRHLQTSREGVPLIAPTSLTVKDFLRPLCSSSDSSEQSSESSLLASFLRLLLSAMVTLLRLVRWFSPRTEPFHYSFLFLDFASFDYGWMPLIILKTFWYVSVISVCKMAVFSLDMYF